jgi:hypothetical protein
MPANAGIQQGIDKAMDPAGKRESIRALIPDSVEGIVWAVPAGSEGAPVEGRGTRQDNRLFLDGPACICYCFSELSGKAGSPFHAGRDGVCDSGETKSGSSH